MGIGNADDTDLERSRRLGDSLATQVHNEAVENLGQ